MIMIGIFLIILAGLITDYPIKIIKKETTVISSFLIGQFEEELPNPEIKMANQAVSKA